MVSDIQRKLIEDYCKQLFRDRFLSTMLVETTCNQIENGLLTFEDWTAYVLTKRSVCNDLRRRIEESIRSR